MPISVALAQSKISALCPKYPHAGTFCLFTDIANLPGIFSLGKLLCRSEALKQDCLRVDCASQQVLRSAPTWVQDYVRLYFAPATPMLYVIEGIKRQTDEWPECPQPVYLVFDSIVLTLPGVRLSDGNMGSRETIWQDASDDFFANLPFDDIYHRDVLPMWGPENARIVRRRQAEVLLPGELSLNYLREVVFRSQAEHELAAGDLGSFPTNIRTFIDENWFFAPRTGRPYLDTIIKGSDVSLTVANLLKGDTLVQVTLSCRGDVSARRTVYDGSVWEGWKQVKSAELQLPMPRAGYSRFYLYGHRIADVALP